MLLARDFLRRDAVKKGTITKDEMEAAEPELKALRNKLADGFSRIYQRWTKPVKDEDKKDYRTKYYQPEKGMIWRVSINRPVELAVRKSRLTVKADAAKSLFDISCKNITWAVIDSGIDAKHPAFRDTNDEDFGEDLKDYLKSDDEDKDPPKLSDLGSRVDRTFDFTQLRELLDSEVIISGEWNGFKEEEVAKKEFWDSLPKNKAEGHPRRQ